MKPTARTRSALAMALTAMLGTACAPVPVDRQSDGGAFTGPACVSGTYWSRGEDPDNEMHPGRACIGCHSAWHRGPVFSVAGTIYPTSQEPDGTSHEADECDGFPNAVTPVAQHGAIEVTDATGEAFVIVANRVGNFYTTHPLQFPLQHVRVRAPGGGFTEMLEPAPNGDCNGCHTREGVSEQGRIVVSR